METQDIIIIGSGPSGYTAALYAARANRHPLVLGGFMKGGPSGGQLMTTTEIENFPGFPNGIEGSDLMQKLREQAIRFGADVIDKDVERVDFSKAPFKIWTLDEEYEARTVIISTGASAKRLNSDAEKKFWNRGTSACATCDGALPTFRNKPLAVIGGGDTAMEEAIFLTRFGSSVTIIHRQNEFRASSIMLDRAKANPKINWKTPFLLEEARGTSLLDRLVLRNIATDQREEIPVNGLFVAIGHQPNTEIFQGQIDLAKDGYILTDGHTHTNVPGVFAAGDCVDRIYRQAITAAGQGCMAAIQAERYFESLEVQFPVQAG